MSDHLYYMSIKGGGPGDVHSYFNPCSSPIEAFTVYSKIISDLEARVLQELEKPEHTAKRVLRRLPADRGFTFFHDFARPTKITVQSLNEFHSALKRVDAKVIRFHVERRDFDRWLRQVVGDEKLADKMAELPEKELSGEKLRRQVLKTVEGRLKELQKTSQPPTRS
jgi:alpha-amylase